MTITASGHKVMSKQEIARGIFDIWVEYADTEAVKPGQFVDVRCEGFTLRRPISICEIDRENSRLRLVFEIRGDGTRQLAQVNPGESLDMLAPLGNGFNLGKTSRRAVFVGGGIGVPPLLEAAKPFGGNADVILGFRTASAAILEEDFVRSGSHVTLVTEDGSAGEKGFITLPLIRRLEKDACDVIFACGPRPMLKVVAQEAEKHGVPCFVSMEARMACGVGACLSCACKTIFEGKEQYQHVCKNGPVFDAKRIVW